jgi:phosphoribosylamine-glycine ligase
MGAVASKHLVDAATLARIEREIIGPTVNGLVADGLPYRGFLYFGLMLTPTGPKVIEYNCRFGDPECQAVMPLVHGDLAGFCLDGAKGTLDANRISFSDDWSVCIVLASAGYPASSRNGDVISGVDKATADCVIHSGTRRGPGGRWETHGGRVLAVVSTAATRAAAVSSAHAAADRIRFDGLQRRRDIGILHFDNEPA